MASFSEPHQSVGRLFSDDHLVRIKEREQPWLFKAVIHPFTHQYFHALIKSNKREGLLLEYLAELPERFQRRSCCRLLVVVVILNLFFEYFTNKLIFDSIIFLCQRRSPEFLNGLSVDLGILIIPHFLIIQLFGQLGPNGSDRLVHFDVSDNLVNFGGKYFHPATFFIDRGVLGIRGRRGGIVLARHAFGNRLQVAGEHVPVIFFPCSERGGGRKSLQSRNDFVLRAAVAAGCCFGAGQDEENITNHVAVVDFSILNILEWKYIIELLKGAEVFEAFLSIAERYSITGYRQ
mmetsp:Transcript_74266/g.208475  ORF Transcript_74266/g.208475 Transcript_74266/m.208475 type:complete len:291 (+) Transcript_74266:847-1719(+)